LYELHVRCRMSALSGHAYEPIVLEALQIEAALLYAMKDDGWAPARTAAEQTAIRLGAAGLQREILRVLPSFR
jgi:hypothetical protein